MTHPLEPDATDFSHVPYRGQSTRPNDFFSYFVTEEDSKDKEYLMTAHRDDLAKLRPFVNEVLAQLPAMGEMTTYVVGLKVGVNLRDIRDIVQEDRPGGSLGVNRRVYLA
jgi:hypothetical protein